MGTVLFIQLRPLPAASGLLCLHFSLPGNILPAPSLPNNLVLRLQDQLTYHLCRMFAGNWGFPVCVPSELWFLPICAHLTCASGFHSELSWGGVSFVQWLAHRWEFQPYKSIGVGWTNIVTLCAMNFPFIGYKLPEFLIGGSCLWQLSDMNSGSWLNHLH